MWLYVARRLFLTIPIGLGVTIICFALVYLAPGDPIQSLLPPDASEADKIAIKKAYGLDEPIPVQYVVWLGKALIGDLGKSIQTNRPVIDEVMRAFGNTITIAVISVVLAMGIALVLGIIAAIKVGSWADRLSTAIAVLGISVPTFWLGVVLVIVFSVNLGWLPATGMGEGGSEDFSFLEWESLQYAILPIIAMTLTPLGILMRTTRSTLAEILGQDFIQTLRAKGLSEWQIIVHAIWNGAPQILAMLGLQLGYLVGGSILVETIFTWPGTGFVLNTAILTRDIPLLQGTILVLAMAFVLINLIVDLLQTLVDPRIKRT
ncbi:ABC transporter permease [Chthonobacter albigriseus]|uniref:ABC transporter permease n=1 Tax=Chthonobacter albigriseus TaxID=1683161 RepID=UPI0015EFA83C|nr:ABC transporter permease [Chthonobacter albigriseus]